MHLSKGLAQTQFYDWRKDPQILKCSKTPKILNEVWCCLIRVCWLTEKDSRDVILARCTTKQH